MATCPSILADSRNSEAGILSLHPVNKVTDNVDALTIRPVTFTLSTIFNKDTISRQGTFLVAITTFSVVNKTLFRFATVNSIREISTRHDRGSNRLECFVAGPLLEGVDVSKFLNDLGTVANIVLAPLMACCFTDGGPRVSLVCATLFKIKDVIKLMVSTTTIPDLSGGCKAGELFTTIGLVGVFPGLLLFTLCIGCPRGVAGVPRAITVFMLALVVKDYMDVSSAIRALVVSRTISLRRGVSNGEPSTLFFSTRAFVIGVNANLSSLTTDVNCTIIGFSSSRATTLGSFVTGNKVPELSNECSGLVALLFVLCALPITLDSLLSTVPFVQKRQS